MAVSTAFEIGTLDDYLNRICEAIQLSQSQHQSAVKRYRGIGEYLSEMNDLAPEISPQGSMLQRTTNRPMRKDKEVVPFDLDAACICCVDPATLSSKTLYENIHHRMRQNHDYADLMRQAQEDYPQSYKGVRLAYRSDDFCLDVVPACKDPADEEGIRLLIAEPSKWTSHNAIIETWKRTDPFRFAALLEASAR